MPFYALGGPATHWTHGNFEKGLISFGANFVGALVGGLVGQGVVCGQSDVQQCSRDGFFAGLSVAVVTVPIADALILGWEDIPEDDPLPTTITPGTKASAGRPLADGPSFRRHQPAPIPQFSMTPGWSLGPRGEFAFGVSGRF
jgi:hypothetical protein